MQNNSPQKLPVIVTNELSDILGNSLDTYLIAEMLEYCNPGFIEWVEQTQLFAMIKKYAGTGLEIKAIPTDMQLKLTGINKIEVAGDLPVALLYEFYRNSPFFVSNTIPLEQLKTNNDERDFTKESTW